MAKVRVTGKPQVSIDLTWEEAELLLKIVNMSTSNKWSTFQGDVGPTEEFNPNAAEDLAEGIYIGLHKIPGL